MTNDELVDTLVTARDGLATRLAVLSADPALGVNYASENESRTFQIAELSKAIADLDDRILILRQRTPGSYRLNRIQR